MILITDYGRHCKLSASQAQALCPKNTRGGGGEKGSVSLRPRLRRFYRFLT